MCSFPQLNVYTVIICRTANYVPNVIKTHIKVNGTFIQVKWEISGFSDVSTLPMISLYSDRYTEVP